jgi:hypothetical protein
MLPHACQLLLEFIACVAGGGSLKSRKPECSARPEKKFLRKPGAREPETNALCGVNRSRFYWREIVSGEELVGEHTRAAYNCFSGKID